MTRAEAPVEKLHVKNTGGISVCYDLLELVGGGCAMVHGGGVSVTCSFPASGDWRCWETAPRPVEVLYRERESGHGFWCFILLL